MRSIILIALLLFSGNVLFSQENVTVFTSANAPFPHNYIANLTASRDGRIWLYFNQPGKDVLLLQYDGKWNTIAVPPALAGKNEKLFGLYFDENNTGILLFSKSIYAYEKGVFRLLADVESGMPAIRSEPARIMKKAGAIWLGNRKLHKYEKGRWQEIEGPEIITSLAPGKSGEVLVGTVKGIYQVSSSGVAFTPCSYARSAIYDPQRSCYWAISQTQGLLKLQGQSVERYTFPDGAAPFNNQYNALLLSRGRHIWLGCNRFLFQYIPGEESWKTVDPSQYAPASVQVNALAEDAEGFLWVAAANGLLRLRKDE